MKKLLIAAVITFILIFLVNNASFASGFVIVENQYGTVFDFKLVMELGAKKINVGSGALSNGVSKKITFNQTGTYRIYIKYKDKFGIVKWVRGNARFLENRGGYKWTIKMMYGRSSSVNPIPESEFNEAK